VRLEILSAQARSTFLLLPFLHAKKSKAKVFLDFIWFAKATPLNADILQQKTHRKRFSAGGLWGKILKY